jgi:hypothetical protein
MKKILFLLTMAFTGSLWAAGDVTVQVISAVHEKSLTKELDDKVKKTGLKAHKKLENGRYVVTLGTFKNERAAQKALEMVRHTVSSDAFVRLVQRSEVAHTAVANKTTHAPAVTKHEKAVAVKDEVAHTSSQTATPHEKPVAVIATVPVAPVSVVTVTPAASTKSDCDKREIHKGEIGEAIEYYKNSPYHRFEPIATR